MATDTNKPRTVACPHCGKAVEWAPEARWRPFCSERCKMIDFGAWATGRYRVPVVEDESAPPDEAQQGGS